MRKVSTLFVLMLMIFPIFSITLSNYVINPSENNAEKDKPNLVSKPFISKELEEILKDPQNLIQEVEVIVNIKDGYYNDFLNSIGTELKGDIKNFF